MKRTWKSAAKVSLIYMVVGAIWILASDLALIYLFADIPRSIELQTVKGWFFIFATGVLLFWLVYRQMKKLEESEERLGFALEGSGDGVWDWHIPTSTVWFSKKWKSMLGYDENEIGTGLDEWSSRVHPEDMPSVLADLQPHLDGKITTYVNEHRVRCKNGTYKWILDRGQVISRDDDGKPLRVVGVHTDITERKQSEERLKLAATVFTHAREGIIITDATSSIIEVNDTFTEITGYSREEVIGRKPRILQSGRQSPEFYADMWQTINTIGYWRGEIWNRRKDGESYIETLTITTVMDASNKVSNYVALFTDITQIKSHQNQLEKMANYDVLTDLPNRVLLADRLSQSILQCKRHGMSLAVVFLDLDGFKRVNDLHGHDIGDELLIVISQRMKLALREGDTLARIGGDEFVAVLADLEKVEDCQPVLERLLLAASSPVTIEDNIVNVSASIGVTVYPQDSVDADLLMRHADQAMYVAKELGKNRYHLFDTTRNDIIKVKQERLLELRQALDNQQFVLHYQPQVNMRTGKVIGLEALIRWQHPEQGLLPPNAFLPSIENSAMSIDVGEWVIDTALTQISLWQTMGLTLPDSISVNIAATQLEQPDFTHRLKTLLDAHPDVAPHHLELEVLETSALEDTQNISTTMKACIALGVKFAIDDFGTGYSSLTYLRHLPADLIKIDQSFVCDMLIDNDDLAIVEGVISLSKSFKRAVIAEGVETIEHGTVLLEMGCELAQGYGIAKPLPADDIPAWLTDWKPNLSWGERE
jgi:diguanylate cyclase (GGDEF)-like protein/PAS domain S-box-containing protein